MDRTKHPRLDDLQTCSDWVVSLIAGMEWWNGMVEWKMEWNGECT